MFLTSEPRARNLIIRPWLRPYGISRVDIMIRDDYAAISHPRHRPGDTGSGGDSRRRRPDGNNVGGPSHAAYTDCTTASRSNSPNYKIIILRLAPPGNTRDQIWPPLSSRPHSPCVLRVQTASLLILSLHRSFLPAVFLSVRFSSILVDCPTRRVYAKTGNLE